MASSNGSAPMQILGRLPKENLAAIVEVSAELRRAEVVVAALRNHQTIVLRNALGSAGLDPAADVTVDLETGIVSPRDEG